MRFPRAGSGSLLSSATHALGWSFGNNALSRLGTLGIGIVLARLLGPHAFGTFAVALVALVMLLSFNELGVSLAIVRWQGDPTEIAPTVATISIVTSVLIYIGCFFGAPSFSAAMGAPEATNVIRVLAINVVIDGVVSTPVAMMQRYFRQDKKMIADQANSWLGAAVSIILALIGFGAMSLAIGRLTGALVSGVLFVVLSPQPLRLGFNRGHARALLRFGLPLAGASIIVFAITDADQLIVGHFLGATLLGYYALAINLSNWPLNMFSVPVRSVAPALFSRLQHDRRAMRVGFVSGAALLASVAFPICMILSGAAGPLIHFVYGPRWALAAHILVWLGMLTALRVLFEFVYDYFVVLARSRVVFTVQLVWLIVLIPALVVGAKLGGTAGVAMAEVAVAALLVLPWYLFELSRVGIPMSLLSRNMWFPLIGALGVGLLALRVGELIHNSFAALVVIGLVALTTVGMLLNYMKPQLTMLRPVLSGDVGDTPDEPATAETDVDSEPEAVGAGRAPPVARPPWDTSPLPMLPIAAAEPLSFQDTITAMATTAPLPIYREAAGPIMTYRDPAGRLAFPQGPTGRHRKLEPPPTADALPRPGGFDWTDESRDFARPSG
jgi:O-antigen/teichoic acid export membrane protein